MSYLHAGSQAVAHYDISEQFGREYLKAEMGENAVNGF
jgi:hypothetical protein